MSVAQKSTLARTPHPSDASPISHDPLAKPSRISMKRPWPILILPSICLLLSIAVGLWNAPALLTDFSSSILGNHTHTTKTASNTKTVTTVPLALQLGTQTTMQQYMNALFNHQYSTMWALLHPQVQAMWPSEAAFTTYWTNRYQDYTLKGFVYGRVQWLPNWVNPEIMQEYKQVLVLPVSLILTPNQTLLSQQQLASPEDLHPEQLMQNLPFIVQRVAGQNSAEPAHWYVLDGGPADLEAPILPPIQPLYTTVKVPILMYHHISDDVPTTQLGMSLTVTSKMFNQQLDYLKQQGYHTITFNQLFDALYYGGPLPSHPIILTFDDGYDDAFNIALPILKAHGYSGMFYIITGKVGWSAYLTWQQIRTLLAQGMQIGSHTVNHVDMGDLYLYSQAMAQDEVQVSKTVLQQHLGIQIQQFCYPSGSPFKTGSLWLRQQIMSLLAANGYVGATTDPGMSGIYQSSLQPLALLRIRVDGRSDLHFFENSIP